VVPREAAGSGDLAPTVAQARLDERRIPPYHRDLVWIDIHADHLVARLGKTGRRDTADIAGEDANALPWRDLLGKILVLPGDLSPEYVLHQPAAGQARACGGRGP